MNKEKKYNIEVPFEIVEKIDLERKEFCLSRASFVKYILGLYFKEVVK
jgi:hypothetical protein